MRPWCSTAAGWVAAAAAVVLGQATRRARRVQPQPPPAGRARHCSSPGASACLAVRCEWHQAARPRLQKGPRRSLPAAWQRPLQQWPLRAWAQQGQQPSRRGRRMRPGASARPRARPRSRPRRWGRPSGGSPRSTTTRRRVGEGLLRVAGCAAGVLGSLQQTDSCQGWVPGCSPACLDSVLWSLLLQSKGAAGSNAAGREGAGPPATGSSRGLDRQPPPVPRFDVGKPPLPQPAAAAAAAATGAPHTAAAAAVGITPAPGPGRRPLAPILACPSVSGPQPGQATAAVTATTAGTAAALSATAAPGHAQPAVAGRPAGAPQLRQQRQLVLAEDSSSDGGGVRGAVRGREEADVEEETAPVVMSRLAQRVQRGRQSLAPHKVGGQAVGWMARSEAPQNGTSSGGVGAEPPNLPSWEVAPRHLPLPLACRLCSWATASVWCSSRRRRPGRRATPRTTTTRCPCPLPTVQQQPQPQQQPRGTPLPRRTQRPRAPSPGRSRPPCAQRRRPRRGRGTRPLLSSLSTTVAASGLAG